MFESKHWYRGSTEQRPTWGRDGMRSNCDKHIMKKCFCILNEPIGFWSRHLLYKRGSSIDQGRLERKLNRTASVLDWLIGEVWESLKERFKRSYRDTTKSVAAADVLKTGKYSSRRWRTGRGRLLRVIPLNYAFFHKHTFSYGIIPPMSTSIHMSWFSASVQSLPILLLDPPRILMKFCANLAFKSLMKFRNNIVLAA